MSLAHLSQAAKPMPLNQGQQDAADGFSQFLFSDDKELIISGAGGTGKTFLMGYLIDKIMPQYFDTCKMLGLAPQYDGVEMTATTNKAADALSLTTGRPTQTIHSFLKLKVTENFQTGKTTLTRTGGWAFHTRIILFVDECSMIDRQLWQEILSATLDCKIVYVGDHNQLAPVTESLSPIYRQGIPFFELTEPMRNSRQPALMALCNQVRRSVETGEFHPIQIVPGVIDHLDDNQLQAELAKVFAQPTHTSRVLAYTNTRVVQFNDHIRSEIRHQPDEWQDGEFVISNSAARLGKRMLQVEEELEILNQKAITDKIAIDDGVELEVRPTTLRSVLGDVFRDVPVPVDRQHFTDLLKWYAHRKNWAKYHHLKAAYPDLRQRDAATVHKAQGSTYDSVFIDLGNLSTCHNPNQAARLLYVAVSRARSRIFLYGELSTKYGGLVRP